MLVAPSARITNVFPPRKVRQQVAAVCYRIRKSAIQFLLVQSRGGRWIFPKGGVEPHLTYAQSAALEAFEEAGVHGRIEALPFARYLRRQTDRPSLSSDADHAVIAYLCEVSRLEAPQEANRKPTWFSAEKAKQRLQERRPQPLAEELNRVVDRALARIERLHNAPPTLSAHPHKEELRQVRFEVHERGRFHADLMSAALARHFRQHGNPQPSNAAEAELPVYLRKILHPGATQQTRPALLRLGAGPQLPSKSPRKITAIDTGRKATR